MICINSGVPLYTGSCSSTHPSAGRLLACLCACWCTCACVCVRELWGEGDWLRRGEKRTGDIIFEGATLSEELWNYAQVESWCEYWCREGEYICVNKHTLTHRHTHRHRNTVSRQLSLQFTFFQMRKVHATTTNEPALWEVWLWRLVTMFDCVTAFLCGIHECPIRGKYLGVPS